MSCMPKKKTSTAECAGEIAPPRLLIKSIEDRRRKRHCALAHRYVQQALEGDAP